MALPESHQKERLSEAYISAVVAKAGQGLEFSTKHVDYGIDGNIHLLERTETGFQNAGPWFRFQIKATVNCTVGDTEVSYTMEPNAYNKCVHWRGHLPIVLIVYSLPRDNSTWVSIDEKQMILRDCAYWRFMNVDTFVTSRKVVKIPRNQVFNENAISYILELAEQAPRVDLNFD